MWKGKRETGYGVKVALSVGVLFGGLCFAACRAHASTYLFSASVESLLAVSDTGRSDPVDIFSSGDSSTFLQASRVEGYTFTSEAKPKNNPPPETWGAATVIDFSDSRATPPWVQYSKGATQDDREFLTRLQAAPAAIRLKLSRSDPAGAEEVLRSLVAGAPQSPLAALAVGQLYAILNLPDKAETQIKQALQLRADYAPALLTLGGMQLAGHRLEEADRTYQRLDALPGKEYKGYHALFLFQTGKREAALAEFIKLASADPNDRTARTRLFEAFVLMGRMPEARSLVAAVLKRNPHDTDALLQRAGLALKTGNAQLAEEDLKQVLRFEPDSPRAHFGLAQVYRSRALNGLERQELDKALQLNPGMLPARLALARNFLLSKEPKSAIKVLNETPENQRAMLGVIAERNWAQLAIGNIQEMRGTLDRVLRIGRYPELVIQDAVLRMKDGNYAGARADAGEVLQRNPLEIRAARILVDSYVAQNQPLQAIESLAKLAREHPNSAPFEQLLGEQYLRAGKLREARKAFEAAKSADPASRAADLALVDVDCAEDHLDAAVRRLRALLASDPEDVKALLLLAHIQGVEGSRGESIKTYRTVLNVDGTNLIALNNLAYALASDNPDQALKYAQQARAIAPDNAAVQDTLGCVYYRKGNYGEAVRYLKAAMAKEPTPRRGFHLAMSYMKAGNRELGLAALHAALLQDPNLSKTERGW